ncbi:SIMPL domain-containing protein [Nocardia sp. NPDC050717]|uniref:SIMPL domain-containing protein n=1 Tax=Nocardia sp. NPDC050717 TaxID=3157221 RepID=UPI0033CB3B8E
MAEISPRASVTMFGYGSVRAVPDLVRLTLSVESRSVTVVGAYGRAGDRVAAVVAALRAAGVRDADMATSGLSVQTETVYTNDRRNEIVGYLATTGLTVSLREDIGADPAEAIASAVAAGGDDVRLGGLNRSLADPEPLRAQARDAAFDHALAKAEQYAARAGIALGEVVEITENTAAPVPQAYGISAEMSAPAGLARGGSPIPMVPGETEISATVRVTWALARS